MRKILITLGAALILSGCNASPPPPAVTTTPATSTFWPTYLRILKGQQPPDQACHPTTAEQLLLPCDQPK